MEDGKKRGPGVPGLPLSWRLSDDGIAARVFLKGTGFGLDANVGHSFPVDENFAAPIINEIIAVIVAKQAFGWSGEMRLSRKKGESRRGSPGTRRQPYALTRLSLRPS